MLGSVGACSEMSEDASQCAGKENAASDGVLGGSLELGKTTARRVLGGSGSLLEFMSASGDARGSLRRCGRLWFALEARESGFRSVRE